MPMTLGLRPADRFSKLCNRAADLSFPVDAAERKTRVVAEAVPGKIAVDRIAVDRIAVAVAKIAADRIAVAIGKP